MNTKEIERRSNLVISMARELVITRGTPVFESIKTANLFFELSESYRKSGVVFNNEEDFEQYQNRQLELRIERDKACERLRAEYLK